MLKSHEKFHSLNGKRLILIADDELLNRELLGLILGDDYELLYAADGQEVMEQLRANQELLALLLLDLRMPVMSGADVLKAVREEPELRKIPVIVLTSDQDAEVESLNLGAIDFIPKPYPQADVIRARVRRTIELSEDRAIISSTERDPLTGLYNREFFYRYAEQFDQHHKAVDMDAIVIDVNHFHIINERFGTAYGDDVLRQIGAHVREIVQAAGGIVGRREADTFLIYCPHGLDYDSILNDTFLEQSGEENQNNRVRLRMGVYANADKRLDVERRFDRAKMAADTVQGSFTQTIGIYDSMMHERELYAEQLIEAFPEAIRSGQFEVYYQPKFDVRTEIPVLASAEALVRWNHPKMGMISPGVFIPLFEENGLIQTLDHYVWRTAAAQIRKWERKFDFTVPVSVNVSRIDMYDPNMLETLQGILDENQLSAHEILLEITESAYTQDTGQIIDTVSRLREMEFRIEMDDFGTGYSSLNMISTLPIDALKLDMQFIRNAFNNRKDTRMLEVIIDIADYLSVPVIAEGVETEEQMKALRAMGCDFVQGYYFSKPVPASEYEQFVEERRNAPGVQAMISQETLIKAQRRSIVTNASIVNALASDYICIYYVNTDTDQFIEYSAQEQYRKLGLEKSGDDFFAASRKNIVQIAHPDDVDMFLTSFTKENVMAGIEDHHNFTLTYRLMFDGVPVYVHMKISRMEDEKDHHIVVGLSNVDAQIRREQEHARALRLANYDALTGVKSKHAYAEEERKINRMISADNQESFGIVMCDVNGLKQVNDALGHKTGDQFLKDACKIICTIFRHSPVFRVGGDEFAVLLRNGDYEIRMKLMRMLENRNLKAEEQLKLLREEGTDGVVGTVEQPECIIIAGGLAVYRPGEDGSVSDVFERADAAMYENKKNLKERIQ